MGKRLVTTAPHTHFFLAWQTRDMDAPRWRCITVGCGVFRDELQRMETDADGHPKGSGGGSPGAPCGELVTEAKGSNAVRPIGRRAPAASVSTLSQAQRDVLELAPGVSRDLRWLLIADGADSGLCVEEPECTCTDDDPCPGCRWRRFDQAIRRMEEERDALTPAQEAEPVHHVESEQVVLGAFLQSSITFARLAHLLCADDFFISAHRHIFEAMCEIGVDPTSPGLVTLQLERRGLMGVDVPRELPVALALAGGISLEQANHAAMTVAALGKARRKAGQG